MTSTGTDQGESAGVERRIAEGPRGAARTWYDVLELKPGASAADVKAAYERALALVDGRSIGGYLMLDPAAAESARADVEAAFAVLGDAERRAAYDAGLGAPAREQTVVDRLTAERPTAERPAEVDKAADKAAADKPAGQAPAAGSEAPATMAPADGAARAAAVDGAGEREGGPDVEEARAILGMAPGDSVGFDDTRSSGLKFLAPEAEPAPSGLGPPRTDTPKPASGIRFEPPATDSGETAPAPARAAEPAPAPEAAPPLVATATVLPTATMPAPDAPPAAEAASVGSTLPEEITGALIHELRVARGLSLEDVADQTKVRKAYLKAIEDQDVPNLPARVYLRGFLTQVGRVLKVDRTRLAEGYLKTIEKVQRG